MNSDKFLRVSNLNMLPLPKRQSPDHHVGIAWSPSLTCLRRLLCSGIWQNFLLLNEGVVFPESYLKSLSEMPTCNDCFLQNLSFGVIGNASLCGKVRRSGPGPSAAARAPLSQGIPPNMPPS